MGITTFMSPDLSVLRRSLKYNQVERLYSTSIGNQRSEIWNRRAEIWSKKEEERRTKNDLVPPAGRFWRVGWAESKGGEYRAESWNLRSEIRNKKKEERGTPPTPFSQRSLRRSWQGFGLWSTKPFAESTGKRRKKCDWRVAIPNSKSQKTSIPPVLSDAFFESACSFKPHISYKPRAISLHDTILPKGVTPLGQVDTELKIYLHRLIRMLSAKVKTPELNFSHP